MERSLRGPLHPVLASARTGRDPDWAARPIPCSPRYRYVEGVSRTEILLWIVALFVLELNHLKWIWWEYWDCRQCTAKHKDCACGKTARWIMYI